MVRRVNKKREVDATEALCTSSEWDSRSTLTHKCQSTHPTLIVQHPTIALVPLLPWGLQNGED